MKSTRRKFVLNTMKTSAFIALAPWSVFSQGGENRNDAIPSLVDLHAFFKTPVIIKQIEIVRTQGKLFVKTTSGDGIVGITQCNERMDYLVPIFNGLVVPCFLGKDARDLEGLVRDVYNDGRNYKYAGMPFSNCVGHLELSIWDLLGKTAKQPASLFFGKPIRTEVPVYLSSLTRDNTADEEIAALGEQLEKTGALAIKLKVGGRMTGEEKIPGRSNRIISLARKTFGNRITIYADSNGSYSVKDAIAVGKMLEEHGVKIFEEPCPWEDNDSNKKVAAALHKITVAGGEQDTSLHRFQHIINEGVYDLVQPDLYYNGGLLRCVQVGNMAAKKKFGIAPHSPKADPLESAMLQFAAISPNLEGFQEYPSNPGTQPSWYSPHFNIVNGKCQIPIGPGLGVSFDDSIWKKQEKL